MDARGEPCATGQPANGRREEEEGQEDRMRPPPREPMSPATKRILDERARSFALRKASRSVEHVAVCLIGYPHPVPRDFGDNQGAWPVRVSTTAKPRDVASKPDLESPLHQVKVLEMVWTPSDRHAKRLKAKLDELLLGSSEDARLRHGWRNVDDPAVIWPILLDQAVREIRDRGEQFEIITPQSHDNVVVMRRNKILDRGR